MLNSHVLNGPELAILLAAVGLVANATISFFIALKKSTRHR
jgi:hypothetical protein